MPAHNSLNIPISTGTAVISNATSNGFSSLGYTYANTGSYLAQRDVNGNCSFNVVIETTTTIVSAGQTIVMTNGTSQVQEITGTSTVAFNLPDATTLIVGWTFIFNNIGTGICSIYQQNGSSLVETVLAGGYSFVTCASNSTVQGLWTYHNALATGALSGTLGSTFPGFVAGNTLISAYTTTATAATTTTLTVASTQQQYFTGSTTQTLILPVTSTLVLGQSFVIVNNSTGNVTVESSGANTIQIMLPNTKLIVTVISTSLTTAAAWNANYSANSGVDLHVANFIVGSGTSANYSTIGAALTAASSGQTIFIQPGIYTENPNLMAGVNLCAFECDALTPNVIINGTCTFTGAGTVSISGICLQTNSAALLAVTGSAASVVNLTNCYLNCLNNSGITYSSSSASSGINISYCTGNLATTGIALVTSTSPGRTLFEFCVFTNSGSSTSASTASLGTISTYYSDFGSVFSTTSSATIQSYFTIFYAATLNVPCITTAGTGISNFTSCSYTSGTASCVSVGTGTSVGLYGGILNSTNSYSVTGAGTLLYTGLSYSNTASTINVTTQTGGITQGGTQQAPSAGFIGEEIRSTVGGGAPVSLSTGVNTNVTSISVTAGIWDVTGIVVFDGATAGTAIIANIVTTTGGSGTGGDNRVDFPFLSQANVPQTLVIPSYRYVFTTSMTVYLVASMTYTAGTGVAYGRINAVRAG